MSETDTSRVHNPDNECWTNGCQEAWTTVVTQTQVDRSFGYCDDHAEMWEGSQNMRVEGTREDTEVGGDHGE